MIRCRIYRDKGKNYLFPIYYIKFKIRVDISLFNLAGFQIKSITNYIRLYKQSDSLSQEAAANPPILWGGRCTAATDRVLTSLLVLAGYKLVQYCQIMFVYST